MYRRGRNRMFRKVLTHILFSVLFFFNSASVFAAEILYLPYRYLSDTGVAIEATETFVLCDCKAASALAVKPKEVPIALKMTEPFHFSLPTPIKEEPIQDEGGSVGEARIQEAEPDSMKAAGDDSEPLIIGFGFNAKSPAREEELLQAVERIKKSGKEVRVFGHTCDLGGRERNELISLSRAESVAAILKEHGIGVAEVAGMGSCCPRSTDRRENRRVEIFIVNGGDHEK